MAISLTGFRCGSGPDRTDARDHLKPIQSNDIHMPTAESKYVPNWTLQPKLERLTISPTAELLSNDFVFLPVPKMVNCRQLVNCSTLLASTGIMKVKPTAMSKGFIDLSTYKWWRKIFLSYLVLSVIVAIASIPASLAFDEVIIPVEGLLFGQLKSVFIVIFANAFFLMLTTALGWHAYRRQGQKTLVTYTIFLATLFMLAILCVMYSLAMRHEIRIHLYQSMMRGIHIYGEKIEEGIKDCWDNVQTKFQCCGMFELDDWSHNDVLNGSVPDSCCKTVLPDCGLNQLSHPNFSTIHAISCYNAFFDWLGVYTYALIGAVGWLALWQIIGVFISHSLSKITKRIPKTERMLNRKDCWCCCC